MEPDAPHQKRALKARLAAVEHARLFYYGNLFIAGLGLVLLLTEHPTPSLIIVLILVVALNAFALNALRSEIEWAEWCDEEEYIQSMHCEAERENRLR